MGGKKGAKIDYGGGKHVRVSASRFFFWANLFRAAHIASASALADFGWGPGARLRAPGWGQGRGSRGRSPRKILDLRFSEPPFSAST